MAYMVMDKDNDGYSVFRCSECGCEMCVECSMCKKCGAEFDGIQADILSILKEGDNETGTA